MEASTSSADMSPAEQHTCPVCASTFPRLDYLTHHMSIHINENQPPALTCSVCGQGFNLRDELNEHQKSHTDKTTSLHCPLCSKKFALRRSLKRHISKCTDTKTPVVSKLSVDKESDEEHELVLKKRPRTRLKRVVISDSDDEPIDQSVKPNEDHVSQSVERSRECQHCKKTYKSEKALTNHLKSHDEPASIPRSHPCRLCGEEFDKVRLLKRHLKTHTANLLSHYRQEALQLQDSLGVEADVMSDEFSEDEVPRRTRRYKRAPAKPARKRGRPPKVKNEEDDPVKDSVKDTDSEQKSKTGKPAKRRSASDVSPCRVCDRKFDRETEKVIHMRYHTGEKPFECGTCGKGFHTKGNMIAHLQIHKPDRAYLCKEKECDKKFISKAALQRHMLTHTGEKPYSCDLCERSFRHWTSLKLHKDRAHFKLKPHVCDRCGKAFVSPDALKVHVRSHTGERPYKCDMCNKAFAQHAGLHAHRRTHTGEKPYTCQICNKSFYQSSALKDHNLTHTGEKPLKCNVCGKAFALKCALKRHIRIHTGERPYQCEVCAKSFPTSGELRLHTRKHTGEKPYQCEVCGQAFASRSNFKKHLKDHHPNYVLGEMRLYTIKDEASDCRPPLPSQSSSLQQHPPRSIATPEQLELTTLRPVEQPQQPHDTANQQQQHENNPRHYDNDRLIVGAGDSRYDTSRHSHQYSTQCPPGPAHYDVRSPPTQPAPRYDIIPSVTSRYDVKTVMDDSRRQTRDSEQRYDQDVQLMTVQAPVQYHTPPPSTHTPQPSTHTPEPSTYTQHPQHPGFPGFTYTNLPMSGSTDYVSVNYTLPREAALLVMMKDRDLAISRDQQQQQIYPTSESL